MKIKFLKTNFLLVVLRVLIFSIAIVFILLKSATYGIGFILSLYYWALAVYQNDPTGKILLIYKNVTYQFGFFLAYTSLLLIMLIGKHRKKLFKVLHEGFKQLLIFLLFKIKGFLRIPLKRKFKLLRLPILVIVVIIVGIKVYDYVKPPVVLFTYPDQVASEVPLVSNIEIIFDKPMNKKLTERGFNIHPNVAGTFEWEADQKLIFTPKEQLERSKEYTITISGLATSKSLTPLFRTYKLVFSTLGNPKIIVNSPNTESLEPLSPITIIFDRPMIPLTTASETQHYQSPLKMTPNIAGEGKWLGTTSYQFRPAEPYKKGTSYKVIVAKGIGSIDGGLLESDFEWEFSGELPKVLSTEPKDGEQYANPNGTIKIKFDQEIDIDSLNEKYSLNDTAGKSIAGTFSKDINDKKIVYFSSNTKLERETTYQATIQNGVLGIEGPIGSENRHTINFKVAPLPQILYTSPYDGEQNVKEIRTIEVYFNTKMNAESVAANLEISPSPETKPVVYFSSNQQTKENKLYINTYLARSANYNVTIKGTAKDIHGTPLGADYKTSFITAPYEPSITIEPQGTYFTVFNQDIKPIIITKVTNATNIKYNLYEINQTQFIHLHRLIYDYKYSQSFCKKDNDCRNWQSVNTTEMKFINTWDQNIDQDLNVPVNVISKIVGKNDQTLPPGVYFLDISLPNGTHDNIVFNITKTSLTVKHSPEQLLVWSVNQSTGEVVPGVNVEIYSQEGKKLSQGKTNKDGVWLENIKLYTNTTTNDYNKNFYVVAFKNDDKIMMSTLWDEGINKYDFNISNNNWYELGTHKLFVTLDNYIYRPGSKVNFKGVLRKDNDGKMESIPEGELATVMVTDTKGNNILTENIPVNSFGTFWGDFELSANADLGFYNILVNYQGSEFRQDFQVEEFKKPEYKIDIQPSKPDFINNEIAETNINLSYYFGAPLIDQEVKWSVKRRSYEFSWYKDYSYRFSNEEYTGHGISFYNNFNEDFSGEEIAQGIGITNSLGDFTLRVPTNITTENTSQKFVVEANTQDESNQSVAASKEFTVHKGDYYIGIKPESYTTSQDEITKINVVTVNSEGIEVGNKDVVINVYKRTWNTIREKDPDTQNFYYVNKSNDELKETLEVKTNDVGYANGEFVPSEGGTYKIVARSIDSNGNTIQAANFVWVYGENYESQRQNHDRIEIITDKTKYNVNETINILANSPYEKPTQSLITIERNGILEYILANTGGNSKGIQIKAKEQFTPNVFISVVIPKAGNSLENPPEFKIGYTKIFINNPENKIEVDLQTDKSEYKPQEKMQVKVSTKDLMGRAVKSEILIAVVDQAVWDIANVKVEDLFEHFYEEKSLLVYTSNLLTQSMDRINANVNLGSKGGSGGGGGGEAFFDTSRTNFLNTVLWKPDIYTDNNGNAEVEVQLPDNLTTWKIFAIAVNKDHAFGETSINSVTSKDVLIRPFLPRFLSNGDKTSMGAIVVNKDNVTHTIDLSVQSEGLDIEGDKKKTIELKENEQIKVLWDTVTTGNKNAQVGFEARHLNTNEIADAVQTEIPINLYYTKEVVATAGKINEVADEKVSLPKELVKDLGSLEISVAPIVGMSLLTNAEELIYYPYSCGEQIASRLTAEISTLGLMEKTKQTTINTIEKEKLLSRISLEIQDIYKNQNTDGGWSWWPNNNYSIRNYSDPFITAYTYFTLKNAELSGITVSPLVLAKSNQFLKSSIKTDISLNTKAYILYVLNDPSTTELYSSNIWSKRFLLSLESRAYLATAMKEIKAFASYSKRLHDEVLSTVKKTATTAHWEERSTNYYTMGSDRSTTAAVVDMMIRFNKNNPLIDEALRYLSTANTKEGSTKTQAKVMESTYKYVLSKDLKTLNRNYKVELDNTILKSGLFNEKNILDVTRVSVPLSSLVSGGSNNLKFSETGQGDMFYNVDLTYYLPFEETKPLEQGFTIIRELLNNEGQLIDKNNIHEGDDFWIRLQIVVPEVRRNVIVEDILPAGIESINKNLKNAVVLTQNKPMLEKGSNYGDYYFSKKEFRDDRTVFFAEQLTPGIYELTYKAKATIPGNYHYPPVRVQEMYVPDISGHSSGGWIEILSSELK